MTRNIDTSPETLARLKKQQEALDQVRYTWHKENDLPKAEEMLRHYIATGRSDIDMLVAKHYLANVLDLEGKWKEAQPRYKYLITPNRVFSSVTDPSVLVHFAEMSEKLHKPGDANLGYKLTVALRLPQGTGAFAPKVGHKPRNQAYLESMAYTIASVDSILKRHYDDAVKQSSQAVRRNPADPIAQFYLAHALLSCNRLVEARKAFLKTWTMKGTDAKLREDIVWWLKDANNRISYRKRLRGEPYSRTASEDIEVDNGDGTKRVIHKRPSVFDEPG